MQDMNSAPAYELRVLSGQQRGATSAVCLGDALRIGRDWSSDVVLQQADDSAALLTMDANGQLTLNADTGLCLINGGTQLQAGEDTALAPYTSFTVGGVTMAVGRVGASQWAALFDNAEADAAADTETSTDALTETSTDALADASTETPAEEPAKAGLAAIWFVRRLNWMQRFLLGGAALVSASVGMLTLAWAMNPANLSLPERATHLRQTLAHAGFSTLNVEIRDNELLITGHLNTLAQRSQLEQSLVKQTPARLAVWVNDQVTASVGDVYRLNGISAEVHSSGPGVVHVKTHEANIAALDKVQSVALRDVPGLVKLVPVNDPPPAGPPTEATLNDPGKRLAAIVPGDPAYVVTVDNTRYFEGAMLPTGHRIVSILSDHIQIERDGVVSELRF
jgi:type III secretion protein D